MCGKKFLTGKGTGKKLVDVTCGKECAKIWSRRNR